METLLYQTNRRLAEPPLVLAPQPACASDLVVQVVPTGPLGRVAYRGLWRVHPSLHYLTTFWRAAAQAMRRWRPAVIQVGHVALAPLGVLLARRARRPLVVYAYGQELLRSAAGPLDGRLRGGALRAATAIVSCGSFTSSLVAAWGVPTARLVEVPFGAEPRPNVSPPSGSTLLSVARLVPRKGIDTVLRALASLPESVTYRVVGSGPDEARLRQLARDLGVARRVAFLGRLSDAELGEEYQRCSVFVLPARRVGGSLEGFGLVFFEAAAWGRPVVAGRSGGEIDAVVDGETGLLVDGGSVEAVADAIRGLLDNPERLRRLGEAGRRRVETTHNWTAAAGVVDELLARVAG